jgi:hypothetical protein
MHLPQSAAALIILALLSGCTTASVLQTQGAASGDPAVGLHYFLPRGKIRIVGSNEKSDSGNPAFKITTTRVIGPDRSNPCFLIYHRSLFHDDDFTLEVDEAGLLKTVNATSTDQSPAIIESLTDTVVNVLKLAAQAVERKAAPTPRPFVYTFDPLNPKERNDAVSFLASEMGIKMTVETEETKNVNPAPIVSNDGVQYHPPLVVTLRFSIGTDSNDFASHILPNPAVTRCLSLRRASLVKQDTQLTFANGMPTRVKFTRPSQALAAVQIPQKIVKTAADAIPQIIKIQNEAATRDLQQKTAVLQAQQNYLQAQIELRRKEDELKSLEEKAHAQSSEKSKTDEVAFSSRTTANGTLAASPTASPAPGDDSFNSNPNPR